MNDRPRQNPAYSSLGFFEYVGDTKFMKILMIILALTSATPSHSGELVITEREAIEQGYTPFENKNFNKFSLFPHLYLDQLQWPFELPYQKGFMGNNFAQYQPYRPTPGYHSGSDMILEKGSWMYAPVTGRLDAGHYAYTHHKDGSRTKQWKPWPQKGRANYFEVAITDVNGNRFEFHHIDRKSLPKDLKACLDTNRCYIQEGEKLGQVVEWTYTPFHYTHVHLNVVSPSGEDLNPEHFFEVLPDDLAPIIQVSARMKNGRTVKVQDGAKLTSEIQHFVVTGYDQKNDNQFKQMPLYYELKLSNGKKTVWDFRKDFKKNGEFQDLREVFTGRKPRDYYPVDNVNFSVKLENPSKDFNGNFVITVKDIAGNSTRVSGSIKI